MKKIKKIYFLFLSSIYKIISFISDKKLLILYGTEYSNSYQNIPLLWEALKEIGDKNNIITVYDRKNNVLNDIFIIYKISKASIIVVDSSVKIISNINISKKTKIIYCGHGGGAYKKMAFATLNKNSSEKEKKRIKRIHGKYSYIICSSEKIKSIIRKNYNIDISKIKSYGIPRTDLLFSINIKKEKEEFLNKYSCCINKKIILYAPTFRIVNNKRVVNLLINEKKFNDNFYSKYCFLFRIHPTLKKINLPLNWIDVSDLSYEKCLAISDILVSDYSSIIFDYSFFKRPIILFSPDIDKYQVNQRKLWYTPKDLVGNMFCNNTDELIDKLNYNIKSNLWERFMDSCDGNSSKRISNWLIQLLKEQNEYSNANDGWLW